MSIRNSIILLCALSTLTFLAGCGSSSNTATAPPSGGFSNSNLNGTYVFSFSGTDYTDESAPSFFAVAGTLTANGSGGFTGGTVDINDPGLAVVVGASSSVQTGLAATGSYSITADGRGMGTITVTVNGTNVPLGLDFVLSSSSGGLITRFDANGTGSGTIDLQSTGSLQSAYTVGLVGATSGSTPSPVAVVGSFTLGSTGAITTGIADVNNAGTSVGGTAGLAVTGSVTAGSPGNATFTTSAGTFAFDVYMVDNTHLKFIETDTGPTALAGDAFTQQTSMPSGVLAYTMTGVDVTEESTVALGGFMTSDGSSQISAGIEDYNDLAVAAGTVTSFTGSFIPVAGGRTVLTLNAIYNGADGLDSPTVVFAAYPSSGGIQLLEIDGAGITGGAALQQTTTSFAGSQGYGLNLTGANADGEVDMIAEFTATSSNMTGLYDVNNAGVTISDANLGTGTYSVDSTGRGTASFPSLQTNNNSAIGALDFNFYVVDGSTALLVETDNDSATGNVQEAVGTLLLQSASGAAPAIQRHVSMARPMVLPHAAAAKRQKKN
jgi:hypothetical protein